MKKIKFIYNPNSGEKNLINKLDDIIYTYQKNGYTVIPYRLNKDQDMSNIFVDMDKSYDHILISGGDGTLDSIINEIIKRKIDIPIGILPMGTANDFARALGITDNVVQGIKNIISSKPKLIDVGKINDKYFINVASAGMFTDVSQKINPDLKNYMGRVSYYITGIEEALHMRKFDIKVTSKEVNYEGDMYLMLIFNGKTAGNINLAYKAELDDGYLDVMIIKGMPIPKSIPLLVSVMRGEHLENINQEEILYFKTKDVKIKCSDELKTDIDGEKGPKFPLNISCIEGAIKILGIK